MLSQRVDKFRTEELDHLATRINERIPETAAELPRCILDDPQSDEGFAEH